MQEQDVSDKALLTRQCQRRLASSTYAIYESLKRRLQNKRIFKELESLSPAERLL